jgi:hypothetical protein
MPHQVNSIVVISMASLADIVCAATSSCGGVQDGKTLGHKVKGWASRRKGASLKRRESEEIVCVNHNPIHNYIKVRHTVCCSQVFEHHSAT